MKVLIATDAAAPQVNGVVRTYEQLTAELCRQGVEVEIMSTQGFRTLPCPTYPEIRLALPDFGHVRRELDRLAPDAIHIATEGPVGWMVRQACLARGTRFTTSFHTRFPEYIASRFMCPRRGPMRRCGISCAECRHHGRHQEPRTGLESKGLPLTRPWTRGVDQDLFKPRAVRRFGAAPVFLYAGRVAVEKNLDAFLALDLPGRKVVVGDGPSLAQLKERYRDVSFTGALSGVALAESYASADVFVFPSRTDTFGMVILEAMASGLPVAAFPVTGPKDLVTQGITGVMSEDLRSAAIAALSLDRARVREAAMAYSWRQAAQIFLSHVERARSSSRAQFVPHAAMRSAG